LVSILTPPELSPFPELEDSASKAVDSAVIESASQLHLFQIFPEIMPTVRIKVVMDSKLTKANNAITKRFKRMSLVLPTTSASLAASFMDTTSAPSSIPSSTS